MVKQITPIKDLLSGALTLTMHFFSHVLQEMKKNVYIHIVSVKFVI